MRCELIVKKFLPVLLYGIGDVLITYRDIYKLHIAYRKICTHIFKISLRASISNLLNAFNITPNVELIENKTRNFMRQCLDSRCIELQFLSIRITYGLRTLEFESGDKKTGSICILTSCCT